MSGRSFAAANIRLTIGAGKAAPTPPIGPALGARGIKSMDFCKEFNARTADYIVGTPLIAHVHTTPEKTFSFKLKSPTTTWFLMKAAGIESTPGDGGQKGVKPVGKVSLKVVYEIAKVKHQDAHLQGKPLYAIASNIVASAKNLGIEIVY